MGLREDYIRWAAEAQDLASMAFARLDAELSQTKIERDNLRRENEELRIELAESLRKVESRDGLVRYLVRKKTKGTQAA